MTGRAVSEHRRQHEPVTEYFDPRLTNNPSQGEARDMVLAALDEVEPGVLKSLAGTCFKPALLDPDGVAEHDWPGPPDELLWGHVRDAGNAVPPDRWIVHGNLKLLRDALTSWARGDRDDPWNLCDNEGTPLEWIADAAVQTLVSWNRKDTLPNRLKWENLDYYCYRALDSDESMEMLRLEQGFDAGSGYLRIAPESGAESEPFSSREQRAAKQQYKSLGRALGLRLVPRVSKRYFEWYALQMFLGWKLMRIREREEQSGRACVGHLHDLSGIAHGIAKVADLVGFRR